MMTISYDSHTVYVNMISVFSGGCALVALDKEKIKDKKIKHL